MTISIEYLGCYSWWVADVHNTETLEEGQLIANQAKQKVSDGTIPECLHCFIQEAKKFSLSYGQTAYESEQIVEYIKNILSDADFQKDPQNFMEEWASRRGCMLLSRPIEDPAKLFFSDWGNQRVGRIITKLRNSHT